jgi:hypothetical protein
MRLVLLAPTLLLLVLVSLAAWPVRPAYAGTVPAERI